MSNIRNELLFSGDESAIMNMLESVINRKSQTLNFNDILPVPSELVPLPANLARVKIDCYLTAVNPKTADYHREKLPADVYDRQFKQNKWKCCYFLQYSKPIKTTIVSSPNLYDMKKHRADNSVRGMGFDLVVGNCSTYGNL